MLRIHLVGCRPGRFVFRTLWAGFVWLALAGGGASAEDSSWWNTRTPESEPGVVVGLSGSVAVPFGLDDHVEITAFRPQQGRNDEPNLEAQPAVGLHARAGYRFNARLAAEAHFEWIPEWSIEGKNSDRTNPTSSSKIAKGKAWTLTADLKLYLATRTFQPYLTAGLGAMRFEGENDSPRIPANDRKIFEFNIDGARDVGFAVRAGAGLDIMMTDRLALVLGASYVVGTGDVEDYDYLSTEWGLQYRF
jgi:opacity protein-like surface antigen